MSEYQSFVGDELEETEDVSDVMSPERAAPSRLEPVGRNDSYSLPPMYLQRSVPGQEGGDSIAATKPIANPSPSPPPMAAAANDESSLSQHALDELAQNISHDALAVALSELSADDEADSALRPHSSGDGSLEQYRSPYLSQYTNTKDSTPGGSLSQYTINETDDSALKTPASVTSLAQYPVSDEDVSHHRQREPPEQKSKSDSSSDMAMYQTRPGTVIERPETDGHNDQDDVSPPLSISNPTMKTTLASKSLLSFQSDNTKTSAALDSSKSTNFDHSIKFQHYTQSLTLGDSVMDAEKSPIGSSTPTRGKQTEMKFEKSADEKFTALQEKTEESLVNSRAEGAETTANWSLNKVPMVQYVSSDDRAKLLGASFSAHRPKQDVPDPAEPPVLDKVDAKEMHSLLVDDLAGDGSRRVSDSKSARSSGSLEQFTLDPSHSVDTSVWSSARTSLEKDAGLEFEELRSSTSSYDWRLKDEAGGSQKPLPPPRSPTSEGMDLIRGPSPKETLQKIAANSPSFTMPGLSLARENASLDLYDKPLYKKGSDSLASSTSSGGAQHRSGTDSMLHYEGRDRLSQGSVGSDDRNSVKSGSSTLSKGSSRDSKGSQHRPETVGRGSNEFQPLVPTDSMFEITITSKRGSYGKSGPSEDDSKAARFDGDWAKDVKSHHSGDDTPPLTLDELQINIDARTENQDKTDRGNGLSADYLQGSGEFKRSGKLSESLASSGHSAKSVESKSRDYKEGLSQASSRDSLLLGSSTRPSAKSEKSKEQSQEKVSYSSSSRESVTTAVENIQTQPSSQSLTMLNLASASQTSLDFKLSTPSSARSSQGSMVGEKADMDSKRSSLSIGATADSVNRRGSLSERVAQILADNSTPTVSTPRQQGSNDTQDAQSDVDSDVERITGEYKAILKGVTAKLTTGEGTGNIEKMTQDALNSLGQIETNAADAMKCVSESDIIIETVDDDAKQGPSYKYVPQAPLTAVDPSSGSETEDALDRDVKRLLAKYGRHLSSDEDTSAQKKQKPPPQFHAPPPPPLSDGRESPAGSAYSTDDTLSHRVHNLLLKSADFGSTQETAASPLPGYLYDDPARSMTLPMDMASTTSSQDIEQTSHMVEVSQSDPVPRKAQKLEQMPKQIASSVDTLHEKVSAILTNTGQFDSDSSHQVSVASSRSPSRASSVDYKALQQDLIELENNLEHMKSGEATQQQPKQSLVSQSQEGFTPATSTVASEYSTPKKYTWDHAADIGANEEGRFMCTQELDSQKTEPRSPGKMYYSALPLSPLLTHGVVPMDVALDILHGPEHAPLRSHKDFDSFNETSPHGKSSSTRDRLDHSPARRQIKFDDPKQDRNSARKSLQDHTQRQYVGAEARSLEERERRSLDHRQRHQDEENSHRRNLEVSQDRQAFVQRRQDGTESRSSDEGYTSPNKPQHESFEQKSEDLSRTLEDLSHSGMYVDDVQDARTQRFRDEEYRRDGEVQTQQEDYIVSSAEDDEVCSIHEMSEKINHVLQTFSDSSRVSPGKVDTKYDSYKEYDDKGKYDQRYETKKDHSERTSLPSRKPESNYPKSSRTSLPPAHPRPDIDDRRAAETLMTRKSDSFQPRSSEVPPRLSSSDQKARERHSDASLSRKEDSFAGHSRSTEHVVSRHEQSAGESFETTPLSHKPFTVFGNMQNLFANQRDKASASQFDESIELRSPIKRRLGQQAGAFSREYVVEGPTPPLDGVRDGRGSASDSRLDARDFRGTNSQDPRLTFSDPRMTSTDPRMSSSSTRMTSTDHKVLRAHDPGMTSTDPRMTSTDPRMTSADPRLSTEQLIEKYTQKLHDLERKDSEEAARQREQRIREELEAKLSGLSDSEASYHRDGAEPPMTPTREKMMEALRDEREDSAALPQQRQAADHHVPTRSSLPVTSSSIKRTSPSSNLRPYCPPGSTEQYYVEATTTDDCNHSIATVETVESTRTGSDDARAPVLPSHVYGTSPNPPTDAVGVYGATGKKKGSPSSAGKPQKPLNPIQEQSFDSRDTDQAKLSSGSSRHSSNLSRKSQQITEEKERSFTKARDWVNGTYPSREDLTKLENADAAKEHESGGGHFESLKLDEDRDEKEMALNQRAAEIRRRFEQYAKDELGQAESFSARREVEDVRVVEDVQNKYEQRFGTPKKSSRNSPAEQLPVKTRKEYLGDYVSQHRIPDERDMRASFRGYTKERDHSYDKEKGKVARKSPSPVDLHQLPVNYDIRNDRFDPTTRLQAKSPTSILKTSRSKSPNLRLGARSTSPKVKKSNSGRSTPSSPSRCRSPEKVDELDNITSFDKFYAKLDRYSDKFSERGTRPRSPARVRTLGAFSPLEPDMEEDLYRGGNENDTANTSSLMKYANSFVTSATRSSVPTSLLQKDELSTSSPLTRKPPSSHRSHQHESSPPTHGVDSLLGASTISPYSTATDRFQQSKMDSPTRFSPSRRYNGVDSQGQRSYDGFQGQRSYEGRGPMARSEFEAMSPGLPENAQELWEKFQNMQNKERSRDARLDLAKVSRFVDDPKRGPTPDWLRNDSLAEVRLRVERQAREEQEREFSDDEDVSLGKSVRIDERPKETRQDTIDERLRDRYGEKEREEEEEEERRRRRREREQKEEETRRREERLQEQEMQRQDKKRREEDKRREEEDRIREERRKQVEKERERETKLREKEEFEKLREQKYREDAERELKLRENYERERKLREDAERRKEDFEREKRMRESLEREQKLREENEIKLRDERRRQEQYREQLLVEEERYRNSIGEERRDDVRRKRVEEDGVVPSSSGQRVDFAVSDRGRSAKHRDPESSSNQSRQPEYSREDGRYGSGRSGMDRGGGGSDGDSDRKGEENNRRGRDGGGAGGGGRDPNDPSKQRQKNQEEKKETSTEEEADDKKEDAPKPRKQAWVIRDETLLSIPEDSTIDSVSSDFATSSEIDSEGKQITRTTKRHLPADPKLLKLQQKIARQKEKHRREWVREQKRKDKIKMLERLLIERGGSGLRHHRYHDPVEESSTTFSSTLSSQFEDNTLTASDASTLRDDEEDLTQNHTFTLNDTSRPVEEVECSCGQFNESPGKPHRRTADSPSPSRKKHGHRSPSPEFSSTRHHSYHHSHSPPKRLKTLKEPHFQLKEVDYTNKSDKNRKSRHSATYMEFDKPAPVLSVPKTKPRKSSSSKEKDKENSRPSVRKTSPDYKTGSGKGVKKRDFGATCPTPKVQSPPPQKNRVSMVSEAVQTSPHKHSERRSKSKSPDRHHHHHSPHCEVHQHQRRSRSSGGHAASRSLSPGEGRHQCPRHANRSTSPGMYAHERSNAGYSVPKPRPVVKPAEAWFVPLTEPRPWRRPLSEKQAFIDAMDAWPDKENQKRRLQGLIYGVQEQHQQDQSLTGEEVKEAELYRSSEETLLQPQTAQPGSLQDAFAARKTSFISASRERERHVLLRAEERRIQALHRQERDELFQVRRDRKDANLNAHPISELHYKPIKRHFTRSQMKEHTEKVYQSLPEVKQMAEDKKREDFYKTNRIRAQLYKQPVPFVLRRYKPPGPHKGSKQSSASKGAASECIKTPKVAMKKPKKKKKAAKKAKTPIVLNDIPEKEAAKADAAVLSTSKAAKKPTVSVVRHSGGEPLNTSLRATKAAERKSKDPRGEMSLAAALSRVGIVPSYGPADSSTLRNGSDNNHGGSTGRKGSGTNGGGMYAAQTETVTEIKTLYKFKYRMK